MDIELTARTDVDAARQQLIADATGAWQATRIAESTSSDDEASVEFALPGTALDGLVGQLRRHPAADDVEVTMDVDPEQMAAAPLAEDASAPEPVLLQVNLTRASGGGPWVTILGAVLVAVLALVALALVQRRFGQDEDAGYDDGDTPTRRFG